MSRRERSTNGGGATASTQNLVRENEKLQKINQVLMTRVERSMDMQGSDFALFEHAILLESRVRERTEELEDVLADLRRSHQDLARAKAEAERADRSKTRFLAAASHDLLQPLNAARLFVAALAETDQSRKNRLLIDNIDTAFASVEELLSDLLEISQLDAGVQRVDLNDVPLAPLLKSLSAEFKPMTDEKGLAFGVCRTDAVLRTDRQLFARVLRNLISNAIRYTERGRVGIEVEDDVDACRISVIDSGCGIPSDRQGEIFEEFKRLDQGLPGQQRGYGLGLAIVQRILRLLDHPIELRSEVGEGSCFIITVPLVEQIGNVTAVDTRSISGRKGPEATGTVLVIENEEAIRAGMTALLESWGYRVITATTGECGIAALKERSLEPDLVIADYHLDHGFLGTQAIADIRSVCTILPPAMIITADRSPEVQDMVTAANLPLLTKPVRPAKLRALIRYLTGG